MKHIRDQIRDFLKESGCSANALARASGVNVIYICRVKNGVRGDMASSRADALREAMLTLDHDAARKAGVGI